VAFSERMRCQNASLRRGYVLSEQTAHSQTVPGIRAVNLRRR